MPSETMTPERQFERLIAERQHSQGRILGIAHPTLRLYAHDRGGRLSLRAKLPTDLKLPKVVSTRGIEVELETFEDGAEELAFISRSQSTDVLFLAFVRFAVDRTTAAETEKDSLRDLVDAYAAFRHFMESDRPLGAGALKGLFAELITMRWLMDAGVDPATALTSWKGPYKDNKDFVLPNGEAYEVKSAPFNASKIKISSVEQLEPNGLNLFLSLVRLEPAVEGAEGGYTLQELIDEINERLVAAGASPGGFEFALEAYGLKVDDHASRGVYFVSRPPVSYGVIDDFPRVRASLVPSGVSSVGFLVEIDAMERYLVGTQDGDGSD